MLRFDPSIYQQLPEYLASNAIVRSNMALVLGIADTSGLDGTSERIRSGIDSGWTIDVAIAACDELIGYLAGTARREAILGPQGPKLEAQSLHPWVWEEAAPRWDAGFFRDAVQAGATRVFDVELPKKLGVTPSKNPADLFAAFSPDKKDGTVLRFPDVDPSDASWASLHRGVMLFGQACVMAIRNPRTHRLDVREDQAALEELAALSLLARWIAEAVPESTK